MNRSTLLPALPDRWQALARSTDARCMAVAGLLALVVLAYFVTTLLAVVARGPWKPGATDHPGPAVTAAQRR